MEVSRLLLCQQTSNNFIGHVGGDDFVIISTCADIERQAMKIIDDFETAKSSFYSRQHWQDQQMLAEDRNGQQCYHDLISLSVGILPPSITIDCNEHQLSLYSAQAKKQAKQAKSSLSIFSLETNISA